ncbi:MAG: hypothetical protein HYX68_16970 [Planctomycetes bacterium]|nr:hypothetical protein [Planctomycetota bacterium]
MSLPTSLPDDPTELALVTCDDTKPEEQRSAAWQKLAVMIQAWANHKYGANSELCSEAVGWMWEKRKRFRGGCYQAWCQVVLDRRRADLDRTRRRVIGVSLSEHVKLISERPSTAQGGEDQDLLTAFRFEADLKRLRKEIERLERCFPSPRGNGVHYYAILLVQLRLALARRLRGFAGDESNFGDHGFSDFLVAHLPWTNDELTFRAGWPLLREIWIALQDCLSQPPHWCNGQRFCGLINELLAGKTQLTPDVWRHWCKRAKEMARKEVTASDWDELFAPFLQDADREVQKPGGES